MSGDDHYWDHLSNAYNAEKRKRIAAMPWWQKIIMRWRWNNAFEPGPDFWVAVERRIKERNFS